MGVPQIRLPDNPCPQCGDNTRLDGVILSYIDCFLYGGELYSFEYDVSPAVFLTKPRGGTCTIACSNPPEDIIHCAEFLLQNGFGGYHVLKNNCKDFAIYCKTGLLVINSISVGRSGQAASAASAIISSPLQYLTPASMAWQLLAMAGIALAVWFLILEYGLMWLKSPLLGLLPVLAFR